MVAGSIRRLGVSGDALGEAVDHPEGLG